MKLEHEPKVQKLAMHSSIFKKFGNTLKFNIKLTLKLKVTLVQVACCRSHFTETSKLLLFISTRQLFANHLHGKCHFIEVQIRKINHRHAQNE